MNLRQTGVVALLASAAPAVSAEEPGAAQSAPAVGPGGALASAVVQSDDVAPPAAETPPAALAPGMFTAEQRERILADGRPLYLRHCAACHGARGDGQGPAAPFLEYPPRNFLTGSYNFRMTGLGTLPREEDVFRTVSVGVLGTAMPGWADVLSYAQRRLLTRYVLALSPRTLTELPGPAITLPPEPPDDAASRERGKALFEANGCTACHGAEGRGDGPAAVALVDENNLPIRPRNFHEGLQGGEGAAVAFRAISTGLNGTPMPSFGHLEEAQRWDLAHYVTSLREPRGLADYLFVDPAGRLQGQ